ncbi:hypothetical protein MUK42_07710 [Musa troglodytarum]|uniref:Uncharacterized protein n=1 Tax=Musa troglodytarum TaxID=320322 RepID=A0A9E7E9Q0_9LILI|nr:hypothetical protein MUK42_07710 [Musa troglodytarum]
MITILVVVLCALIGTVVMTFVVRCALSISRWVWLEVPRELGPCLSVDYATTARVKGEEAVAAASDVIVYPGSASRCCSAATTSSTSIASTAGSCLDLHALRVVGAYSMASMYTRSSRLAQAIAWTNPEAYKLFLCFFVENRRRLLIGAPFTFSVN